MWLTLGVITIIPCKILYEHSYSYISTYIMISLISSFIALIQNINDDLFDEQQHREKLYFILFTTTVTTSRNWQLATANWQPAWNIIIPAWHQERVCTSDDNYTLFNRHIHVINYHFERYKWELKASPVINLLICMVLCILACIYIHAYVSY